MTINMIDAINLKIKELQKNLILLKSTGININEDNLKDDMIIYWGIERGIQISIECVLDISNIIISNLNIEKPDTYRDIILSLGKNKVIPLSFSKEIANMISFRNILVHDYTRVDEKVIIDILHNHLDDFAKFIKYINEWFDENY